MPDAEVWNAACRTVKAVPQFSEAPVRQSDHFEAEVPVWQGRGRDKSLSLPALIPVRRSVKDGAGVELLAQSFPPNSRSRERC